MSAPSATADTTQGSASGSSTPKITPDQNASWPVTKDGYVLNDVIGSGATAVVQSAFCPAKQQKCAIKRIDLERHQSPMEELRKEIAAMSACHHENVVGYWGSFLSGTELWVILELCSGGSLLDIIRHRISISEDKCKYGVFDEATIATILREVLHGLDYFHSNNHIHRDIKAGNILLKEDGSIKVADFGVAAHLKMGGQRRGETKARHTFVGTPCWIAPEVIDMEQSVGYNHKADIWSFGITALELATGTAPYHKYPPMKVLMLTLQNDSPTIDLNATEKDQYKQYGKSFRKLVKDCLVKDPQQRPSAKELLKHDFFKKAKDKAFLQKQLLSTGPIFRSQKVKRVPGASGRLHRTTGGEWEWSDEEESTAVACKENQDLQESANESAPSDKFNVPGSSNRVETPLQTTLLATKKSPTTSSDVTPQTVDVTTAPVEKPTEATSYNMVLRLRNEQAQLNDINFDFSVGLDTPDSVAQELVDACLVSGRDRIVVAANVSKMLDNPQLGSNLIFKLDTTNLPSSQIPNERNLLGFGQLTLNEISTTSPDGVQNVQTAQPAQ